MCGGNGHEQALLGIRGASSTPSEQEPEITQLKLLSPVQPQQGVEPRGCRSGVGHSGLPCWGLPGPPH